MNPMNNLLSDRSTSFFGMRKSRGTLSLNSATGLQALTPDEGVVLNMPVTGHLGITKTLGTSSAAFQNSPVQTLLC